MGDDAANVTLAVTELKSHMIDWPVEDVHNESMVFKTLATLWLETKGVPNHKQYRFILQLLGKEVSANRNLSPSLLQTTIIRNSQTMYGETFEGSLRHTKNFRCYKKQTLGIYHQQEN